MKSVQKTDITRRYAILVRRKAAIQVAVVVAALGALGSLLWWLGRDDFNAIARTPGTIRMIAEFPELQIDNPQPDSWEVIVELDTGGEIRMPFYPVPQIGSRICVETRQYEHTRRFVFAGYMSNLETLGQDCSLN